MTATKTDTVRSDNSVSHEAPVTPENDPRLQRIAQLANRRDGLTTRNDIAIECRRLLEEADDHLEAITDLFSDCGAVLSQGAIR